MLWAQAKGFKEELPSHHMICSTNWKGNYRQINEDIESDQHWQELLSEKSTEDAWDCFNSIT